MANTQIQDSTSLQSQQKTTSGTDVPLDAIRAKFDQQLATLRAPDAGQRLRNIMRVGAKLDDQVIAAMAGQEAVKPVENPEQEEGNPTSGRILD